MRVEIIEKGPRGAFLLGAELSFGARACNLCDQNS